MTLLATAHDPPRPGLFDDLASRGIHPAVITPQVTLSYEQLDRRVAEMAEALGAERRLVAVESANTVGALVAYLGAQRGRHSVLLLPEGARASQVVLDTYDPDVAVGAKTGWTPEPRRTSTAHGLHDHLALLLSTSGSTGSPKLVRLSTENLHANAAAIAEYLRLGPEDRAVTTLPMQYCYGLSVINSHLCAWAAELDTPPAPEATAATG